LNVARYKGAEEIFIKARDHYENSAQNVNVAYCDYAVGRVLLSQARYEESEKMLKKAHALCIYIKGRRKRKKKKPKESRFEVYI
jgi:hypothetical protein